MNSESSLNSILSELITTQLDNEWTGHIYEGLVRDGQQVRVHVRGVQQAEVLVAGQHGQGHPGAGQDDGREHCQRITQMMMIRLSSTNTKHSSILMCQLRN